MQVTCPHCQATYELDAQIQKAILVCHRCQTEFTTPEADIAFEALDIATPSPSSNTLQSFTPMPKRKKSSVWPWLTFILLCLTATGAAYEQQAWLQQPWVRTILLQFHYPLTTQSSDWLILKDQSHLQWMDRQDDSRVLLITGAIQNQLFAEQLPPPLQIDFFDAPNSAPIQSITLPIRLPPNLPQIRHAPYDPPQQDTNPIAAHSSRPFTLVLENIPESTREFSISVNTP